MGVPKFFRFISERYPCISELLQKDTLVTDFDNLYLDMNGIIHMCSHPDDNNPHARITEEKMFSDIFHYIGFLFQLISPKKVFYMAIDGVAPRAKMNQQRARRFQTARESAEALKKAIEKGEPVPEGKGFDSNCITPGTVFMNRLHQQLRFFVKKKVSTDRMWARCKIILSGHETPGEGEHKIMDYIRHLRAQPGHNPNTRHCLYGLDADLIMLGFCTHEPNFSILREEVQFSKTATRPSTPDQNNFYLLHLSLLRDYIDQEFLSLKTTLKFPYDIDKIIDDWVLMTFLVGNDFVPNLPNLVINKNALPDLFQIYREVLPTLEGYINESGVLNLPRFETYMKRLSKLDEDKFQETSTDLKYLEGKCGNKVTKNEATFDVDLSDIVANKTSKNKTSVFQTDLEKLISSTNEMAIEDDDLICWNSDNEMENSDSEDMFDREFTLHKKNYYMEKLKYEDVTEDVLRSQAEGYIRAIQWILNYYYQGCSSWSWYYPHHYAPYLSDVINFKGMKIEFEMGKPFQPYEQLLSVLPVASKDLLPEAFHNLMTSENSPIIDYYPEKFETDLNGKINEWEAVVLLPFIDQEKLLAAIRPYYELLSEEEFKRNQHGPMLVYEYTSNNLGKVYAPNYFPSIDECHAMEIPIWIKDILVPVNEVVRGTLPNEFRFTYFPGVPTLKHIEFETEFMKAKVKVFDRPSFGENAILRLKKNMNDDEKIEKVASELLGKVVWSGWPYIVQAKVAAVLDENCKYTYVPVENHDRLEDDEISSISKIDYNRKENQYYKEQFENEKSISINHYMSRLGIHVGDISIIVHVKPIQGHKYIITSDGKLVYGVDWYKLTVPYPLQTILRKVEVSPAAAIKPYTTVEEAFPNGDNVFVIAGPYYGCIADITDTTEIAKAGRIKVMVYLEPEPIIELPKRIATNCYMQARVAAQRCGISPLLFSRITSSVYVSKTKDPHALEKKPDRNINIGLMLKNMRMNEEVVGFTHKTDKIWLYSLRCVDLVEKYICQFEMLFKKLQQFSEQDNFPETELFEGTDYGIPEVLEWIKKQDHNKYPTRPCGTQGLDPEELQHLCDVIDSQAKDLANGKKTVGIKVKPHVLFKESLRQGNIPPDSSCPGFELFDRVVNISSSSSVPLGCRGTVVSIIENSKQNSVKLTENIHNESTYHILFDRDFTSGIKVFGVTAQRLYLMHGFNMLNITAGTNKHTKVNNKPQPQRLTIQPSWPATLMNPINISNNRNSAFAHYSSPTKDNERSPAQRKIHHNNQHRQPEAAVILPPAKSSPVAPLCILPTDMINFSIPYIPVPSNAGPFLTPGPPPLPGPALLNNPADRSGFFAPPFPSVMSNRPVNIQNVMHPDESTLALKSLLKLDQGKPFSSPPTRGAQPSHIPSQEFYKTPPNNIQPPFPGKLILGNGSQPHTMPSVETPNINILSLTPFVPLQVQKKSLPMNRQNSYPTSRNNNHPPPPNVNSNVNNFLPSFIDQPQNVPLSNPSNVKHNNRGSRKSRVAANFNMNK